MNNIKEIYNNLKSSFGVMFNDVKFELMNNNIWAYNINNKNIKTKLNLTNQQVLYNQLMDLAYYQHEDKKPSYENAYKAYKDYKFDEAESVNDLKSKYEKLINDYKNK